MKVSYPAPLKRRAALFWEPFQAKDKTPTVEPYPSVKDILPCSLRLGRPSRTGLDVSSRSSGSRLYQHHGDPMDVPVWTARHGQTKLEAGLPRRGTLQ